MPEARASAGFSSDAADLQADAVRARSSQVPAMTSAVIRMMTPRHAENCMAPRLNEPATGSETD